jgi:hypothetical protein
MPDVFEVALALVAARAAQVGKLRAGTLALLAAASFYGKM